MYSSSEHNSELLRNVLRYFAWAMVAMGIYTLLSGGVNVVSSIMVIAMGYQWLCAAASRGSIQKHLNELALLNDKDCRGCCRNCCSGMCRGIFDNIRGLAVAAITFGVVELLIYSVSFSLLGLFYTYGYYGDQQTSQFQCYAGGSSYCYIDYRPSFQSRSYSIPCYTFGSYYCYLTLPVSDGYSSSYDSNYDYGAVGRWLFYAVGHTAVAAPLNIAWGAITLNLIGSLTLATGAAVAGDSQANEASSGDTVPLLARGTAPTFMVGYGKASSA
jgi:hypothetical protein